MVCQVFEHLACSYVSCKILIFDIIRQIWGRPPQLSSDLRRQRNPDTVLEVLHFNERQYQKERSQAMLDRLRNHGWRGLTDVERNAQPDWTNEPKSMAASAIDATYRVLLRSRRPAPGWRNNALSDRFGLVFAKQDNGQIQQHQTRPKRAVRVTYQVGSK